MSIQPAVLHLDGARGHAASIRRGDTFSHTITFTEKLPDGSRVPVDKSASDFLIQLRVKPRSSEIVATFAWSLSGADNNILTFSLAPDETRVIPAGRYAWDLQETDVDTNVITRCAGHADVDMDVSRAA